VVQHWESRFLTRALRAFGMTDQNKQAALCRLISGFETAELWSRLEVKIQTANTTAPSHMTPKLAALGKIIHIVGNDDVRIERMSTLLTIAVGIV
jgi:hypothetical protein